MKVKVYLHNDYCLSEIMDAYCVTEKQANDIYNATYEVALVFDLKTKKLTMFEK